MTEGEQLQLRLVGGRYCKLCIETPKLGSGPKGGLVPAGGKQVQRSRIPRVVRACHKAAETDFRLAG